MIPIRKYLKSSFVKNTLAYSGTNVISQFITMVRGFVVRKILPPEIMGFWNFVAVVQGFIAAYDLGSGAGATRELPLAHGRGDAPEETRIRSTTLWFTLLQNIVVSAVACGYIYWNQSNYAQEETKAAYVAIIIFLVMSFQTCYTAFYSGAQKFVPFSVLLLIGAIIEGVSFPLCAYKWGLDGIMAMAVISTCVKVVLFVIVGQATGIRIQFRLLKNVLKRLLSFGFFLRVVDFPGAYFTLANILWVTKFMSIEALAIFSLSRGFSLQVADVSTRIGTVYTMRFLGQAGSGTPRHVIAGQMKQFLLFQLLVTVPAISWAAAVVVPFIVRNFIPDYAGANEPFIVLLTCGFFFVLNSGLTNPWVLEKKLKARGFANVVGLTTMVAALAVPWFAFGRNTILDVAYSSVAGYFIYFVYMVMAVGKDYWKLRERIEIILSVSLAAGWTYFILRSGYATTAGDVGLTASIRSTLVMACWSLAAILPIPLYGIMRSGFLKGWYR